MIVSDQNGFTLLELLTVMLILGIISAISVGFMGDSVREGYAQEPIQMLGQWASDASTRMQLGKMPTNSTLNNSQMFSYASALGATPAADSTCTATVTPFAVANEGLTAGSSITITVRGGGKIKEWSGTGDFVALF
jgi:prepilin-type N-terminal cleavage/methylation domain-containing protein